MYMWIFKQKIPVNPLPGVETNGSFVNLEMVSSCAAGCRLLATWLLTTSLHKVSFCILSQPTQSIVLYFQPTQHVASCFQPTQRVVLYFQPTYNVFLYFLPIQSVEYLYKSFSSWLNSKIPDLGVLLFL